MNQVYIFTHIPKTAGTSIRNHFAQHLENHVEFIHLANRGHKQAARQGFENFYQKPRLERNKAKVILGHQVNTNTKDLIDKIPKEVVIFRDPVSWEISRYNQYANQIFKKTGNILSLDEWFNNTNKLHSQFDWLITNYYKKKINEFKNNDVRNDFLSLNLQSFDQVLFIVNLEDSLKPIFRHLNIPIQMSNSFNKVGLDKKNYFVETQENLSRVRKHCENEIYTFDKIYKLYIS